MDGKEGGPKPPGNETIQIYFLKGIIANGETKNKKDNSCDYAVWMLNFQTAKI